MARAGRKRKANVVRTASGRISRATDVQQENVDPILTRMRLFGLSEKDARDQKAGTFVGRLQLTGVISRQQYDAAIAYLEITEAYKRALGAPDGLKSSDAKSGDRGETESYARWCAGAIEARDNARKAISAEQCIHENRGSALFAAVDYVVCRDQQMWHMVGDARIALNALAHHFGLMGKGSKRTLDRSAQIAA